MTFSVRFDIKLDKQNVKRKLERKEDRVLLRTGFFGRRVMRNSIRKAPKKYKPEPGKPPRYHVKPGIKTILFAVDKQEKSLAFGPLRYNQSGWSHEANGQHYRHRIKGGKTVPQLINEGGQSLREIQYLKSGFLEKTLMQYEAFPYVEPAYGPTAEKMAELLETIPL